jgi:hypothetical protein
MPKVFLSLAVSDLLLVVIQAILGLSSGVVAADVHVMLGVLTLLFTCFVQVLVFTYFTVTGKMMSQMVLLRRADTSAILRAKYLKTQVTRRLAALVLAAVFATATGAMQWRGYGPSRLHLAAAALATGAHAWILLRQYSLVVENASIFSAVLRDYSQPPSASPSAAAGPRVR